VLVGGGVGAGGVVDLFEVEGVEDALDAFLQFDLGADSDDLVFVDEDVEKRFLAHGAEADHAVFEKEVAELADGVEESFGGDEVVGDIGVDLAEGIDAEHVEDGEEPAREQGEEHAAEGFDAVGGENGIEDVPVGPFFPIALAVAAVGGFELDGVPGLGDQVFDGVGPEGELESVGFDAGDGWVDRAGIHRGSVVGVYPVRMTHATYVALAVGNTRARWGLFHGKDLEESGVAPSADGEAAARAIIALLDEQHDGVVVMASVNPAKSDAIAGRLEDAGIRIARIGRDVAIPLTHALDDATTPGQDRALCALAAYRRAGQACVVVDAGTAITVDFVDGEGVFQGGVIAPGLGMMLAALHERTAALPSVIYAPVDASDGPFGRDTRGAMIRGVRNAAKGLVRETVEQYAEAIGAYPQIVATGGDARVLFESDDLVESIVPDLQLLGIAEAWLAAESDTDAESNEA